MKLGDPGMKHSGCGRVPPLARATDRLARAGFGSLSGRFNGYDNPSTLPTHRTSTPTRFFPGNGHGNGSAHSKPDRVWWPSRADPTAQVVQVGVPFLRNVKMGGIYEYIVVERAPNGALTSRAVGVLNPAPERRMTILD